MKITKRIGIIFTTLVLTVATFLSGQATLSAFNLHTVKASEIQNLIDTSDPLENLERSADFNPYQYKVDITDSSLNVITVSESVNGYLYVYVYQPSHENLGLRATSINISTKTGKDLKYQNYLLEYVNHNQVYYKYVVTEIKDNKEVPVVFTNPASMEERIYEISGIYRAYDEKLDEKLNDDNDNTINEVVFEVAKQFMFETDSAGKVSMYVSDINLIKITDKFVGFLQYRNGWSLAPILGFANYSLQSHFVAFDTDKKIDNLLEFQIYYETQDWEYHTNIVDGFGWSSKSDIEKHNKVVDCSQKQYFNGINDDGEKISQGWFFNRGNQELSCIQTVEEFKKEFGNEEDVTLFECGVFDGVEHNEITDFAVKELSKCKWFVRFANFSFYYRIADGYTHEWLEIHETRVSNVSLLRLKFETDGIIYNLGVLDNKTTGSSKPINKTTFEIKVEDSFKFITGLILVVLLIFVLWPVVSPIISFVITLVLKGFGFIFKGVITVITLPFKTVKKRRRK